MKCWFCENDAVGICVACGRAICRNHSNIHDKFTVTKSDTSTGHATYYNVYKALKCSECRLEWETWEKGKKILK